MCIYVYIYKGTQLCTVYVDPLSSDFVPVYFFILQYSNELPAVLQATKLFGYKTHRESEEIQSHCLNGTEAEKVDDFFLHQN